MFVIWDYYYVLNFIDIKKYNIKHMDSWVCMPDSTAYYKTAMFTGLPNQPQLPSPFNFTALVVPRPRSEHTPSALRQHSRWMFCREII
jgi:hypothetical protein